jgi:UPF0755 protein
VKLLQRFFKWQLALFCFSLCLLLIVSVLYWSLQRWLNTPLKLFANHPQGLILVVESGDTLSKIAHQLHAKKLLDLPTLFILYARLTGQAQIKIGEYLLPTQTTPLTLLEQLQSNNVIMHKVILLEGKTFDDFLATLQQQEKIRTVIQSTEHASILNQLSLNIDHLEGWFFPDTYTYIAGTTDKALLLQAHQRMREILAEEWRQRQVNLPYKDAYEALIMASVIEKETGIAEERRQIAGVFVRRLQRGMRLQTDPTVIYGLGNRYAGNLNRLHLREANPYNTYVINGLPPTPIAMPGRGAIYAALHPADGDSLFFVAKGDGSHYFSTTLMEHNKAVKKYQIQKRITDSQSIPKVESQIAK